MIRERELQRTAGSVSHTPLCNFFRHSTLISSILIPCIQSHIIYRPFVFVRTHCAPASPPTPSRMTSSTPAPTYRTPTATLLRDAKLLAFSSPRLCPLVFLNFVCAASCCLKQPVAAAASILFVFTPPPACFRSSPSARSCSCTGDSPRIGLGNAPEPPKRSAVPYSRAVAEKDLCESAMQALCAVVSCTSQWRDNFTITNQKQH